MSHRFLVHEDTVNRFAKAAGITVITNFDTELGKLLDKFEKEVTT